MRAYAIVAFIALVVGGYVATQDKRSTCISDFIQQSSCEAGIGHTTDGAAWEAGCVEAQIDAALFECKGATNRKN